MRREAKTYIYFNLHRKDWSQRLRGVVVGKHKTMTLTNVRFHVLESERQRAVAEERRNVHAFCLVDDGDWLEGMPEIRPGDTQQVRYNPFRGPHFTIGDRPVTGALRVYLHADGTAWAAGPIFA